MAGAAQPGEAVVAPAPMIALRGRNLRSQSRFQAFFGETSREVKFDFRCRETGVVAGFTIAQDALSVPEVVEWLWLRQTTV